jgi:hypothetical protein
MRETLPRTLGVLALMCAAISGCDWDSDDDSAEVEWIGQGSAVARCHHAIVGQGLPARPEDATAVGRVAFWGTGRDFRTAHKVARPSISASHPLPRSGPIFETKVPVIVEGRRPIDVAITPADRSRAGLVLAIRRGGPYAEVRFVPCRDQARTTWPAGWVLRDRQPVRVLVNERGRQPSELVVGRP